MALNVLGSNWYSTCEVMRSEFFPGDVLRGAGNALTIESDEYYKARQARGSGACSFGVVVQFSRRWDAIQSEF